MDDFSHPIDWYVGQIDEICDVPESLVFQGTSAQAEVCLEELRAR